ncbi:MAG: winged helix DNA-binding protein [Alphaproteobacteria bacterium]|nr:winged helix DNA-binding protein [Alphaproteobacteria bacterium]
MKREQAERVGRLLLEVAPRVMRLETNALARLDHQLTHRQYRILSRISNGMTSATAMSRAASISLAAISESVDALCRRELVERQPDERDRRASRLALTAAGKAALAQAEQALDILAAHLSGSLPVAESTSLVDRLEDIAENVREQHARLLDAQKVS